MKKILTIRVDITNLDNKTWTDLEVRLAAEILSTPNIGKITMEDDHEEDV